MWLVQQASSSAYFLRTMQSSELWVAALTPSPGAPLQLGNNTPQTTEWTVVENGPGIILQLSGTTYQISGGSGAPVLALSGGSGLTPITWIATSA